MLHHALRALAGAVALLTLVTIAPPRKGKTSGLLIPNLAFPEPQGWGGPAVVFDPKGEVYRSVAARRRALGRRLACRLRTHTGRQPEGDDENDGRKNGFHG